MKQLNEIKRLQQLAGIQEIRVNNPLDKQYELFDANNDYEPWFIGTEKQMKNYLIQMIKDKPGHWDFYLDDMGRLMEDEDEDDIITNNIEESKERLWKICNVDLYNFGLGGDLFIRKRK